MLQLPERWSELDLEALSCASTEENEANTFGYVPMKDLAFHTLQTCTTCGKHLLSSAFRSHEEECENLIAQSKNLREQQWPKRSERRVSQKREIESNQKKPTDAPLPPAPKKFKRRTSRNSFSTQNARTSVTEISVKKPSRPEPVEPAVNIKFRPLAELNGIQQRFLTKGIFRLSNSFQSGEAMPENQFPSNYISIPTNMVKHDTIGRIEVNNQKLLRTKKSKKSKTKTNASLGAVKTQSESSSLQSKITPVQTLQETPKPAERLPETFPNVISADDSIDDLAFLKEYGIEGLETAD